MASDKRWISIQSYKHDGALHRFWDRGFLLENNDDYIVIATKRAKVIESDGRRWFTREPAVTVFSKNDWWNAICMLKNDGICYYCNIASPTIFENQTIKYIDYDLDAKLFTNGEIRILDEREYLRHKKKYQYSEDLDTVLKKALAKVKKMMEDRAFPFEDKFIRETYAKFLLETGKQNEANKNDH